MATQLWEQEIDKTVDWGGDSSTGGMAVSGKYVQKFIKDSLAKKFGFLHYDKTTSKYYVFADETDYNTYAADTTGASDSLLLTTFDAPAPATITPTITSSQQVTVLLGSSGNTLSFKYYIENSSGQPVAEAVTIRYAFTRAGETQTVTDNKTIDYDNYDKKSEGGTPVSKRIDDYITTEGTYTITVTVTGTTTQATTTFAFNYNVVQLTLTNTGFNNLSAIDRTKQYFELPYNVQGGAGSEKMVELFVDGELLYQDGLVDADNNVSSMEGLGTKSPLTGSIFMYIYEDAECTIPVKWPSTGKWSNGVDFNNPDLAGKEIFSSGKHSLQMRVSIPGNSAGERIYSLTKYYDIILSYPESSIDKYTYLIYTVDVNAGSVFNPSEAISVSSEQYIPTSFNVAVWDSSNREVSVEYSIDKMLADNTVEHIDTITHSVSSSATDTLNYTFTTYSDSTSAGYLPIKITVSNGYSSDALNVEVIVRKSDAEVEEVTSMLAFKFSAANRSNTEPNPAQWTYRNISASFNKVLWNNQSGWIDGQYLLLKNGATVTIPQNLFELAGTQGLTFEIDFETSDVQTDDAVIMDFSDVGNNRSYLNIKATSASMNTNGNSSLTTNFKDNERTKIAFVFNPLYKINSSNAVDTDEAGIPNPNMLFIIVNGVLDRVCSWGNGQSTDSDSIKWTNAKGSNAASFTIGNTKGEASVKIYSMRAYRSALTPEQEFMNYMADSSDLLSIYNDNNVLENGEISFELVRNMIPTLVISMDYTMINNTDNKKNNLQCDVRYYDPEDPSLNFYARNCWISCQGTSSMQYPIKNLRLYFGKTADSKSLTDLTGAQGNYETEFWPASEYQDNWTDTEFDNILPYSCNKKVDGAYTDGGLHEGYHIVGAGLTADAKDALAKKYSDLGAQLYKSVGTHVETIAFTGDSYTCHDIALCKYGDVNTAAADYFIEAYRPLRRTGWDLDSDEYWDYCCSMRYSGAKFFERKVTKDKETGEITKVEFKETKKKKPLKRGTEYYGLGTYWRQYQYSGWTDRWTIKADYAESSMCHNAGTGRLWGNAMKNVVVDGEYKCRTTAQTKMAQASNAKQAIDIRTSCDGKPIVIFYKQLIGVDATTGKRQYDVAKFAGLFNIMTDKGSTKLFGFEDLYDVCENTSKGDGSSVKLIDASKVECWECLNNGSSVAQGNSLAFDTPTAGKRNGNSIGKDRTLWSSYESRWPDTGQERHEEDINFPDDVYGVESNNLESFWHWVNFCKQAINYDIDGHEGYTMNPYVALSIEKAQEYYDLYTAAKEAGNKADMEIYNLYLLWDDSGNDAYAGIGEKYTDAQGNKEAIMEFNANSGDTYYYYDHNINMEHVTKTVNKNTIGILFNQEIYTGLVPSFDAKYRFYDADGVLDEDTASKYYVKVYLTRNGSNYYYTDNEGVYTRYNESVDPDDYEKKFKGNDSSGNPQYASWRSYTLMDYFSETKYDHLDVYKCAAYYVYFMRFCGVDQVVKNTMMMTEDGEHWFFINYDNDTILGVRNDGQLIFNWDCSRDTYDKAGNSYSFAGSKSVLWNNLSMDSDFMTIVKKIDDQMYKQALLSTKTVLEYYNEKQEAVWNQRLYNEQERIKYLSTFIRDFNTQKYMLFMHGTRHSHRVWWVNHRWDLYDAMWSTGAYMDKKVKYYLIVETASLRNPVKFLEIESASKYYFTNQSNNSTTSKTTSDEGKWYVELNAGEKHTFDTTDNIAIGDPMLVVGPQKIRVMNFRPGAAYITSSIALCETYTVDRGNGVKEDTNWVKESGAMMTKLLIGDGETTVTVTKIDGTNVIYSLEEIDIRNVVLVDDKGTRSDVIINNLSNLHRYRAAGSGITTFIPAQGVTLYEVSLPESILTIEMTDVTFASSETPLEDSTVKYEGSETAYVYSATTNSETGETVANTDYEFDYTPTSSLTKLTLNNVSGIDTKKFVFDWLAALEADPNGDPTTCTLVLGKINWSGVTPAEMINLYETFALNDKSLTGKVQLIGSDNGKLTQEEYNAIIDTFGADVFKSGNSLVFNAAENMFFNAEGIEPLVDTEGKYFTTDTEYYSVVRGKSVVFNATIFPVSDDRLFEYVLYSKNAATDKSWSIASVSGEIGSRVYTITGAGVTLTNKDGKAILASESTGIRNPLIRIAVVGLTTKADGKIDLDNNKNYSNMFNNMYKHATLADQVIPTTDNMSVTSTGITNNKVYDEETHTFNINFSNKDKMNVDIVNLYVSTSNVVNNSYINDSCTIDKDSISIDNVNKEFKFDAKFTIQSATTTCPIYVTAVFDTDQTNIKTVKYTLNLIIETIYATAVTVYKANNAEQIEAKEDIETLFINATGQTKYGLKITPENYNVAIENINVEFKDLADFTTINDVTIDGFSISVKDNKSGNKFNSFNDENTIVVSLTPKYEVATKTVSTEIPFQAAIVYPEKVELSRWDYKLKGNNYVSDPNIYLTDSQGTLPGTVSNPNIIDTTEIGGTGIQYLINVLPTSAANGDVTEPYSVNITSITFESNYGTNPTVSATTFNYSSEENNNGKTGVKGFNLQITADSNSTEQITGKIVGVVTSSNIENDITLPFELTLLVSRSRAYATSINDCQNNVIYAVDSSNRFYTCDFDAEGKIIGATDNVAGAGIDAEDWIGVALRLPTANALTSQTYTSICMSIDQFTLNAPINPNSRFTSTNISATMPKVNDNIQLSTTTAAGYYCGYEITKYWSDNYFDNVANQPLTDADKSSAMYKIWHMFDNTSAISSMQGYLPSTAELYLALSNWSNIKNMMNYLYTIKKSIDTNAADLNLATINEKIGSSAVYFASSTIAISSPTPVRIYATGVKLDSGEVQLDNTQMLSIIDGSKNVIIRPFVKLT